MILHREQKTLTGVGQSQLAGRSLKKPDTEISLEHGHVTTDGRRGQGKPARRDREATGLRAADERLEICQGLHTLPIQVMLVSLHNHYPLVLARLSPNDLAHQAMAPV